MSLFVTEIKSFTAMSRTDSNRVSETILIPLFKELYGFAKLRNVNSTEKINFPGIDLADDDARVAIQVTSTSNNDKVKHTLTQFRENELYNKYDRLVIYILTERQRSYSDNLYSGIIQNKFAFSTVSDIWDYQTILRDVEKLQIDQALKVQEVLEKNFGHPSNGTYIGSNSNSITKLSTAVYTPLSIEKATLNLLECSFPDTLYVADLAEDITTSIQPAYQSGRPSRGRSRVKTVSNKSAVKKALTFLNLKFGNDWTCHGRKLITFHDLTDRNIPLREVIELGTVEPISSEEFCRVDTNYERVFKSLLRYCLQEKLYHQGVNWQNEQNLFIFVPKEDEKVRYESWVGKRNIEVKRKVYEREMKATKPDEILSCKHFAFAVKFQRYGSKWYILIKPDWFFSYDGYKKDIYSAKKLKWLKTKESNAQVFSHLRFLVSFITKPLTQEELSHSYNDTLLRFGDTVNFDNATFLPDREWNPPKLEA